MMKYVAIKVKGLDHWLWFKQEFVTEKAGRFKGEKGWGKGGALTSVDVAKRDITSRLASDTLQYSPE